jgi:hypothetical protein
MKSIMKPIYILFLFVFSLQTINAQDTENTVKITVSGSGKTQDEAKQVALRSAIEQAFGTFISSKTEILNDQVISDQITSVSNGNIKSFDVLNESQLPDGSWGVTLKAIVSIGKLTSFVQAKGIEIEIKGGVFALNIKQQLLNEQGETKAIYELVGLLHEIMQTAFDYSIQSSNPISIYGSENWEIPLKVTAIANKNMDFCANYCIKTLAALSLSSNEVTNYKSLNKPTQKIIINYKGESNTFYLRNQSSFSLLYIIMSHLELYKRLFTVQSDLSESNGNGVEETNYSGMNFNFLTSGKIASTYSWIDIRTLTEIEKLTGYKVRPRGIISQFKYGGFVVYEKDGHGLVATLNDLGIYNDWESAKKSCEDLNIDGFNDWHLPSKEELNDIYLNLKVTSGIKFSLNEEYWSSTKYSKKFSWRQELVNGTQFPRINYDGQYSHAAVRPVRNF